eukprot:1594141-Amphidinium_carterae.1
MFERSRSEKTESGCKMDVIVESTDAVVCHDLVGSFHVELKLFLSAIAASLSTSEWLRIYVDDFIGFAFCQEVSDCLMGIKMNRTSCGYVLHQSRAPTLGNEVLSGQE